MTGVEVLVLCICVALVSFCSGAIYGYEQREREEFEERPR
jgi:hypothetical protein